MVKFCSRRRNKIWMEKNYAIIFAKCPSISPISTMWTSSTKPLKEFSSIVPISILLATSAISLQIPLTMINSLLIPPAHKKDSILISTLFQMTIEPTSCKGPKPIRRTLLFMSIKCDPKIYGGFLLISILKFNLILTLFCMRKWGKNLTTNGVPLILKPL